MRKRAVARLFEGFGTVVAISIRMDCFLHDGDEMRYDLCIESCCNKMFIGLP